MQIHFDNELSDLKKEILRMGTLVEEAVFLSVESLKNMSREEADRVIENDKKIDDQELFIEEKVLSLLALRQPMATDLRFVVMAMKITTDLERMADLAVDIAQRVLELVGQPLLKPLIDIPALTAVAQQMTRSAIQAFIEGNVEEARKVILLDNEADRRRNLIQHELINDYMAKDPTTATRAVPLLLIARHLERICDHATNIAEDVIFISSAQVVKHHPEKIGE